MNYSDYIFRYDFCIDSKLEITSPNGSHMIRGGHALICGVVCAC